MSCSYISKSAVISKDDQYRFALHRQWKPGDKRAVWVMLNPSTADANEDDPTIRRVVGYSMDWGMDGCTVVNLSPFRATEPADMLKHVEPESIIKQNFGYIDSECYWNQPEIVMCAWGTKAPVRGKIMTKHLLKLGARLNVLRLTAERQPSHPLYLSKALKPQPWSGN